MRVAAGCAMGWVVALAIGVGACGSERNAEEVETPQGKIRVEQKGGAIHFEGQGDEAFSAAVGEHVELPADFPSDVPLPPGAKLTTTLRSPDGFMLSFQTQRAPEQVVAFYREKLGKSGWELQLETNIGEQRMVSYRKGDRELALTVQAEGGATQGMLTTSGH